MTVATKADTGQKHRDLMARKSREQSRDTADIGPIPKRDNRLWKKFRYDPLAFLYEAFPETTGLSRFCNGQKRGVTRMAKAIVEGGQTLNLWPRGFAKSTTSENLVIWAAGYGHRKFILSIANDALLAKMILDSVQAEFETNPMLMKIFPEICHPAQMLEGVPQRAKKQHTCGELTHIEWSKSRCVFPTLKAFPESSGVVFVAKGITANIRGVRFKRPDGKQARPDFVILDDPQDDESARNPKTVSERLKTINTSILRGGSHKKKTAVVMNATIIENEDLVDQLADPTKNKAWQTERIPMLESLPVNLDEFWLTKYADIRGNYAANDAEGQARAQVEATDFYKKNRKEGDKGAKASWKTCYDDTEISAIQHAMNIIIDTGMDAFNAECQNSPTKENIGLELLTIDEITRKQSAYERNVVPGECTTLTSHVDVHPELMYWQVWAWEPNFTGYLIDHGTFPDQKRRRFDHDKPPKPLSKLFPGMSEDERIYLGLSQCNEWLANREWVKTDGVPIKLTRWLNDANGRSSDTIKKACRESPHAALLTPAYGKGVKASNAPISRWPQSQGKNYGPEWVPTKAVPGELPGVIFDTNHWKTEFHKALAQLPGTRGCLYLFKARPEQHRVIAEGFRSEKPKLVNCEGREIYEWAQIPSQRNEPLDNAVGSMVCASMLGIKKHEKNKKKSPKPKRTRRKARIV